MIEFSAPGKAVIWGEYAVLEGAPALVMAVNRYARCRLEPGGTDWRCQAVGFEDQQVLRISDLRQRAGDLSGVAATVSAAVTAVSGNLPDAARTLTDTREFYQNSTKLGIGSSAAICTAVYAALATIAGQPVEYADALKAHRYLQGKTGSGIDVAAAFHGGLIRFQLGEISPFELPQGLLYRFIWSGHPAVTTHHVARFNQWKEQGQSTALDRLCRTSTDLFEAPNSSTRTSILAAMQAYTEALKALDQDARLGIYEDTHTSLDRLATDHQVVYKPCGAGGGDIGVVFSDDAHRLERYLDQVSGHGFQILTMERASHGIQQTR